jgi:hypothetical protein
MASTSDAVTVQLYGRKMAVPACDIAKNAGRIIMPSSTLPEVRFTTEQKFARQHGYEAYEAQITCGRTLMFGDHVLMVHSGNEY